MEQIKAPDLASPQFKANPYPFYARLRAEAPVYRLTLPFWGAVCLVTRYDDALLALKDERFANDWSPRMPWLLLRFARPLTRGMLNRDAPDHTRLRTPVHKAFTPRLIERLRERIQSVCDELLDAAATRGQMELVGEYALPLPITIIGDLLGIPAQDRLRFHAWSKSMVAVSGSADALRALPKIWASFRYFRKLFVRRRADPRDDLVTALVQAEESGDRQRGGAAVHGDPAPPRRLRNHHQPDCQWSTGLDTASPAARAVAAGPVVGGVGGRGAAAVHQPARDRQRRIAREEVAFGSATVAAGELVGAVLGSANRDERQFPDPEVLDLGRDPNRHPAFGQGAHFCLGAPLARLEGRIALTTLLRRFPGLRLAQPPETLRWRKSPVLRGLEALPVTL